MRDAAAGDFVFVDPPYMDQFDGYTGNKFGVAEHYRLYQAVEDARKRGTMVMVTTNDHGYIRGLYKRNYRIVEMSRMQSIAGKGGERGAAADIVIMGY
jgi:DNA adenine methylase